jgi:RNA polymerase sigma factor (sigma-70 family)
MLVADARAAAARDALVAANLRLVVAIARRFVGAKVSLMDLIQEGNCGLLRAAEKFDPDRGIRFASYAGTWIREAMQRTAIEHRHPLYAPRESWRQAIALKRCADELRAASRRAPHESELALASGMSIERIRDLSVLHVAAVEFDAEGPSDALELSINREGCELEPRLLRHQLAALLQGLPERERMVVDCYFGLASGRPGTLAEIADKLGVSRQRVQQIKARALSRLREELAKRTAAAVGSRSDAPQPNARR